MRIYDEEIDRTVTTSRLTNLTGGRMGYWDGIPNNTFFYWKRFEFDTSVVVLKVDDGVWYVFRKVGKYWFLWA